MLRRLLVVFLALSSSAALADTVTITASGTVDSVSQTPALSPLLGLAFSETFVYETPGIGVPTSTLNVVDYGASLTSFSATLGGQSLTGGTLAIKGLFVGNDAELSSGEIADDFDAYNMHTGLALSFPSLGAGGNFSSAITTLTLRDLDHTVLSDLSLPSAFDRSQYELQFLSVVLQPDFNGLNTRADATITSFTISVVPSIPEPEIYAMLLAGLALLRRARKPSSPKPAANIA